MKNGGEEHAQSPWIVEIDIAFHAGWREYSFVHALVAMFKADTLKNIEIHGHKFNSISI